ncbi:exocyst complex component SEC5A-like isoform X1 [Olea europaea var. sylvestris]|uniref:Exocyst complex component SEC5 n=1 Tax=Olea europaea subsp. europaea TaxID=158383 RepID=A0A8S0VGP7_OLEEU|nr:exocyst complex component SEC5A-like isoform X1 [Olea europaea var. sylvestris]CAA3030282.1 exocyst complex component SEC5A-like [Olea europaea subsp. europaea]
MSSDSDEDELLQMALNEQSNRDVNYQKPSKAASKPVRHYVQTPANRVPPSVTGRSANSGQRKGINQQQRKKGGVEEDEDSEVEMLSISSGDEDDRGGIGARNRMASGREDDKLYDGEEPNCWKRVDEAELSRRVREMRDTRAAPVAQKFERKSSAARKALNHSPSLPRGMEWVDPLGLGLINHKTFRLISDNAASAPTVVRNEPLDPSAREKLNYYSEKFDAKLFLSRVHLDTSAADLEAGALSLKTDLRGRTQQKKELVKGNFDCFVSCKTTIDDIESKLKRIEEDPEGSGTSHLFNCIQGVSSISNRAFGPLFERQAQAEKIRSVQGMLQRFRTLFNLPSAIRGNISKGEHDLAVREYRKAKSIVLPSHVGILKRVLEEVEKVMQEFKGMLYKSMEDPNIDLTNLENTVRLLLELEPESDPIRHYLNLENNRIRGLLEKCTLDHEELMENLQNEIHEKARSDAKWRKIQQDVNLPSDVDLFFTPGNSILPGDSLPVDINIEEVDVLRGRYIHRLTAVLLHHLPAFWKVALSVCSGKFAKSSQVSSDSNANSSVNKSEDKTRDGKYSSNSLDEVAGMMRNTLSAYESKVINTFRDLEESNILRPYISDAINEISRVCQAFEAKESVPMIAVAAMRILESEICKIYIMRLCSWMRTSTEEISKVESWIPVSILERNKSPYTISSLPLAFHAIIISAMDHINVMVQSLRSEATKSEDIHAQIQEIPESVRLAFLNCLLNFAGHLELIGAELTQDKASKESPHFQSGNSREPLEISSHLLPGSIIDPHRQLLMVLSNIGYCKDELARELYSKYKHIWLQSRVKIEEESDIQDLVLSFTSLEEKVLAQYTLAKTNLIRTAAVNYLLEAGVEWGAAPAVKGVRDAAVDLLHTLVSVHSEVFAGCKPLLDHTLGILVEGLIDIFLGLFHENQTKELKALDPNGFCQLMLELEYFETILNPYFTHDARESLKSLQGVLLEKAAESGIESIETPSHQRRATRGVDDVLTDDRQSGTAVSPDDLIALAQQYSSELLQAELERTRINTACFVESIALDSVPESAKAAYASFRDSPNRSFGGTQSFGSPSFSRRRHG